MVSLCACGVTDLPVQCPHVAYYGLLVVVADSTTSSGVTADSVTVQASDGDLLDSVRVSSAHAFEGVGLALNRAGTYVVDVSASGYEPWGAEGIEVTAARPCGVNTVELNARLRPI